MHDAKMGSIECAVPVASVDDSKRRRPPKALAKQFRSHAQLLLSPAFKPRAIAGTCNTHVGADVETGGALGP